MHLGGTPDNGLRFRSNYSDVLAGVQRRKEVSMLRPDLPGIVQNQTELRYYKDFSTVHNPKAIVADETKNLIDKSLNEWSNIGSTDHIEGYPMIDVTYHELQDPWRLTIAVEIRTAPV